MGMRYSRHRSVLLPLSRLTPQIEGFPWHDLHKILQEYRYVQFHDIIHTARCLPELLYVKHGYSSLSLFLRDELVHVISYLSTV